MPREAAVPRSGSGGAGGAPAARRTPGSLRSNGGPRPEAHALDDRARGFHDRVDGTQVIAKHVAGFRDVRRHMHRNHREVADIVLPLKRPCPVDRLIQLAADIARRRRRCRRGVDTFIAGPLRAIANVDRVGAAGDFLRPAEGRPGDRAPVAGKKVAIGVIAIIGIAGACCGRDRPWTGRRYRAADTRTGRACLAIAVRADIGLRRDVAQNIIGHTDRCRRARPHGGWKVKAGIGPGDTGLRVDLADSLLGAW